jgi:PIN like domain
MRIPVKEETWEEFLQRAKMAILDPGTHAYVDTSFLMWLAKVGRTSRKELFDWLDKFCDQRIHVPAWAAHEFLNHHVAGTVGKELETKIKEMSALAKSTYAFLRPFFDDPLAVKDTAQQQQRKARTAMQAVSEIADIAKRWKDHSAEHSREVIDFVSKRVPPDSSIFAEIPGIHALGVDRYDGRIPPGFQDRHKAERFDSEQDAAVGSNRWGDLLFWKEILAHAKSAGAQTIVVLSRDTKNDWHFGGRPAPDDKRLRALGSAWKPLPTPHPTLELEARKLANVESVLLLDSMYLAAVLREHTNDGVKALVDVAIVPDLPSETAQRKELAKEETGRRAQVRAAQAAERGVRFIDGALVATTKSAFMKALNSCKTEPYEEGAPEAKFLARMDDAIGATGGIAAAVDENAFAELDNGMLARIGRSVHDRALSDRAGYDTACVDLIGLLRSLPQGTAGSLLLGVLVSMFLLDDRNARLPPHGPVAKQVFDAQDAPFAQLAVDVMARKLDRLESLPLYVCNASKPAVSVTLDIEPENDGLTLLASVRINGVEVLSPAQPAPDLNLRKICGAERVSGEVVVRAACDCFSVPFDQVTPAAAFAYKFDLSETAGFKNPNAVYRDRSEGVRNA